MTLPTYAMGSLSFPEMYERSLVAPLFKPWAELLLDRVGLQPGDRVLDVACGTGIVARLARQRLGENGTVVGVDVSPQMLEVARAVEPAIEWREGDAGALPLQPGESFTVVTCHQGLQFFRDKPAAVAAMRGALAPGGGLALGVWRSDEEMPLVRELRRVAEKHVGPIEDTRYGFGDPEALRSLLVAGGFREVEVETSSLPLRFENGEVFVRMNTMAFIGMSAGNKERSDEERARLVTAIAEESLAAMAPHFEGAALEIQSRSNLAVARA